MTGEADGTEPRYWAFISYSHKDAAFGRLLHRRLESYFLPRRLVGRSTAQGVAPRRLVPIFRDREEFPAAADLSAEVRAALAQSRCLVVVCSPDAAASQWVSREVELFRALHLDRPVLAALHSGEPTQAFPPPMFGPGPDGERIEPLAADFRPHRDGTHLGLLKLVAGITGLGLDELVQRDAQRNLRRVTAVTAAALVAVLLMGALTFAAIKAREEAERQRSEAEGLVEFMLTDLRDRLKGVGRLDVMTAVNQRALHYYEDQNLASLPVASLERRARILHAMGEDDENRGDHRDALAKFREAERTTADLLAQAPNDPERIYDHAQSVYWIAYSQYQRGYFDDAKRGFVTYEKLADRLVALDPTNAKYRNEVAYAEADLCSVSFKKPVDPSGAMQHCAAALVQTETAVRLAAQFDHNSFTANGFDDDIINALAYLADAYRLNGNPVHARAERFAEEKILDRRMKSDPNNMELNDTWIALQIALARIDCDTGQPKAAKARLLRAVNVVRSMTNFEPNNKRWSMQLKFIRNMLDKLGGEP